MPYIIYNTIVCQTTLVLFQEYNYFKDFFFHYTVISEICMTMFRNEIHAPHTKVFCFFLIN